MVTATFSAAFRRDAVAQITGPGYPVSEVSERLGDRTHGMSPKGKARLKPPPDFCNNASCRYALSCDKRRRKEGARQP